MAATCGEFVPQSKEYFDAICIAAVSNSDDDWEEVRRLESTAEPQPLPVPKLTPEQQALCDRLCAEYGIKRAEPEEEKIAPTAEAQAQADDAQKGWECDEASFHAPAARDLEWTPAETTAMEAALDEYDQT